MAARIAKAARDAKTGRKAVQKVASQVKKAERQLDDALDKLQGVNKNTPGRKSKSDGITVGKKELKQIDVLNKLKEQRWVLEQLQQACQNQVVTITPQLT